MTNGTRKDAIKISNGSFDWVKKYSLIILK